jgi:hypothetical protein
MNTPLEKRYTIEMEDRDGYLWVLVGGKELTAEISAQYWNEIGDRCASTGRSRVLIEKDFERSVGPEQMIQMAEHLSKVLPHGMVAFHDRRHHDAINELGKKLARNRDVMFQVFDDLSEAEKWLKAN